MDEECMACTERTNYKLDDWWPICITCMTHMQGTRCSNTECVLCSMRDCTHNDPLHYYDGGCPSGCNSTVVRENGLFGSEINVGGL
jgi:hypothetical protein